MEKDYNLKNLIWKGKKGGSHDFQENLIFENFLLFFKED